MTFSPDGTTLAVGANDSSGSSTVTLWNLSSPARPRQFGQPLTVGNGSDAEPVAVSPDGKTLAVGVNNSGVNNSGGSGTVTLWDISSPAHPREFSQFGLPLTADNDTTAPPVNAVAFSPDGKTLAAGADDGTVTLWNVSDPAHPRPLASQPILDRNYSVQSVAFSPDGTTLAVGATGGFAGTASVTLCNLGNPAHPRQCGGQPFTVGATAAASGPVSVGFSPNGSTLAVGTSSTANTVTLWNVSDPAHPRELSQPFTSDSGNAVESVAFSRDGTTLAAADGNAVALWDVSNPADPSPLGQPLATGSGSPVDSVAFSPDGAILAAGDSDGAQVWNRDVRSAVSRICDLTAGELTPQQWNQYIPQLPYDPPCSSYQ